MCACVSGKKYLIRDSRQQLQMRYACDRSCPSTLSFTGGFRYTILLHILHTLDHEYMHKIITKWNFTPTIRICTMVSFRNDCVPFFYLYVQQCCHLNKNINTIMLTYPACATVILPLCFPFKLIDIQTKY